MNMIYGNGESIFKITKTNVRPILLNNFDMYHEEHYLYFKPWQQVRYQVTFCIFVHNLLQNSLSCDSTICIVYIDLKIVFQRKKGKSRKNFVTMIYFHYWQWNSIVCCCEALV